MLFSVRGNITDIENKRIYQGEIIIKQGKIESIEEFSPATDQPLNYILPGFIDSHVHIESSMLVPAQFARLAAVHGTVATVSDPHEIANVCGMEGVKFMIENGNLTPFKFYFGAPSCVPATVYETTGASLNVSQIEKLLEKEEIKYLSEMMNFPGVLKGDPEVLQKIAAAKSRDKPVDGHAPGLVGDEARKYIEAGIATDHECFTKEEALDKLKYGMKIIIREGSAAKNFEALADLLNDHPDHIMFCSDDKHPDSLVEGHINQLCARAVVKGIDVFNVLKAACINPVHHYKLGVGLLKQGDAADFIVVKDLKSFEVVQTYIGGELVAEKGKSKISSKFKVQSSKSVNNFNCCKKEIQDFAIQITKDTPSTIAVIEALDGQLITNKLAVAPKIAEGKIVSDVERDILKIVVVNRYQDTAVAKAFIKNFGLKQGAIASSVAHDSHNIVAVGADDDSLCRAVNLIIANKGGISAVNGTKEHFLALPVGGLMSEEDGYDVAAKYSEIDKAAKALGSALSAPFMTLSFMALLVIPHLKLSDKGLFDGDGFRLLG
jgi:adenine deaminase